MDPRLVILDLDGTLVDLHGVIDFDGLLVQAMTACGGMVPPRSERMGLWHEGRHHETWLKAKGIVNVHKFWARFDELDAAARTAGLREGRLTAFPDARGAINRLRQAGTILAVLTNAPFPLARMELQAFDMDLFDIVLGLGIDGHDQSRAKPEPDGILHLQQAAARLAGNEFTGGTVMIGDSAIDMLAAWRAGVPGILVARNGIPGELPTGTTAVLPSLDELDPRMVTTVIDRFHREPAEQPRRDIHVRLP